MSSTTLHPADPLIHLNGSSGTQLLAAYEAALTSVDKALADLRAVDFHSRDYYPRPGSWDLAHAERVKAFNALHDVRDQVTRIRDSIHTQIAR
jgi:hypothetical protein